MGPSPHRSGEANGVCSIKAALAPWHMPMSSACQMATRPVDHIQGVALGGFHHSTAISAIDATRPPGLATPSLADSVMPGFTGCQLTRGPFSPSWPPRLAAWPTAPASGRPACTKASWASPFASWCGHIIALGQFTAPTAMPAAVCYAAAQGAKPRPSQQRPHGSDDAQRSAIRPSPAGSGSRHPDQVAQGHDCATLAAWPCRAALSGSSYSRR